MATAGPLIADAQGKGEFVNRSRSSLSCEKNAVHDPEAVDNKFEAEDLEEEKRGIFYRKYRPYILFGVAAAILGWWISATVLPATRHRW